MRGAVASAAPLALLVLLGACHARVRPSTVLPPLDAEGEVRVYLQPIPEEAPRLGFSIAGMAAKRADGSEVPLALVLAEVSPAAGSSQHLLASGRLPAGDYDAISIRFQRATLTTDEGVADLLVPEEPVRVAVPLALRRGHAVVVQLRLRPGQAQDGAVDFEGAFDAATLGPASAVVQASAYTTSPDLASVAVFDRRSRQVVAVIPTGREPRGIAVSATALRAYVALTGEDQVQILDLGTGEDLRRIPLSAGDEPSELALTPDGRMLVVANRRSSTLAFVDVDAAAVVGRVTVGEDPAALLLDPGGRRAYLLGRRSSEVTVVDVGNRTVLSRVPTDPEPVRAQLNRAGDRLFVVHRGSAYMTVFSLPDLALVSRIFVGLGASAVEIDPRTGFLYVAHGDESRVQVFDPALLLPVDDIAVPGPVSYLGLDPAQNVLMAVVPSRGAIAFVELTRRRVTSSVELGADPYLVVVPGGRN